MSEYKKARWLKKELSNKSQELEQKLKADAKELKKTSAKYAIRGAAVGFGVLAGVAIVKMMTAKPKDISTPKKNITVSQTAHKTSESKTTGGFKSRIKGAFIAVLLEIARNKVKDIINKSAVHPEDDTQQADQ